MVLGQGRALADRQGARRLPAEQDMPGRGSAPALRTGPRRIGMSGIFPAPAAKDTGSPLSAVDETEA